MAVYVAVVDALRHCALNASGDVVQPQEDPLYGARVFSVRDPEGDL